MGTPVGTSLIDAHAGGIGTLESVPREEDVKSISSGISTFTDLPS